MDRLACLVTFAPPPLFLLSNGKVRNKQHHGKTEIFYDKISRRGLTAYKLIWMTHSHSLFNAWSVEGYPSLSFISFNGFAWAYFSQCGFQNCCGQLGIDRASAVLEQIRKLYDDLCIDGDVSVSQWQRDSERKDCQNSKVRSSLSWP
jgi:hypothetical protein